MFVFSTLECVLPARDTLCSRGEPSTSDIIITTAATVNNNTTPITTATSRRAATSASSHRTLCVHNPAAPPISSPHTGGCALASPGSNARSHSNRPCLTADLAPTTTAVANHHSVSQTPQDPSTTTTHSHSRLSPSFTHHQTPACSAGECLLLSLLLPPPPTGAERPFHSLNPTLPRARHAFYHHHRLSLR